MKLFRQFLRAPSSIGAIASSSSGLSNLITDTADLQRRSCVVELGPGTGAITKGIIEKIPQDCIFFCLEANPDLADETRKACPNATVYHASAKDIQKYLSRHGKEKCDCIMSGLPWASFDNGLQEDLLDTVHMSLEDGGVFLTSAYLTGVLLSSGRNFKSLLESKFSEVKTTGIVWKNLPPAYVYLCRK